MQTSINYITRQRWREKGAVMKFKAERFKNHLKARHKKRKPTSQEQYDLKYFSELKNIEIGPYRISKFRKELPGDLLGRFYKAGRDSEPERK